MRVGVQLVPRERRSLGVLGTVFEGNIGPAVLGGDVIYCTDIGWKDFSGNELGQFHSHDKHNLDLFSPTLVDSSDFSLDSRANSWAERQVVPW